MLLDIRDLIAESVRSVSFDFTLALPEDFNHGSPNFSGVNFPVPLMASGTVTNTSGYMVLSLVLSAEYNAQCARCLREVNRHFEAELQKTVVPKNTAEGIDEEQTDDVIIVEDGMLDLENTLIDLLYTEFPAKVLCRQDCRGLCQRCGKDLNDGPCECKPEMDPRLAPLKRILEEMKEKENQNNK